MDFQTRFWGNVDVRGPDECWLWKLRSTRDGYGALFRKKQFHSAHRMAYELSKGAPGELHVMHKCDVRRCCNPAHLTAGTRSDNMRDMIAKGRHRVARPKGYSSPKLVPSQVKAIRVSSDTVLSLSRKYGVSPRTIRDVKARKRYAWVA